MSNNVTAHEPINYLDSILNEEESRCEYSHQRRNFTISRSGRFKSKNKKRDAVDGKLFDNKTKDETFKSKGETDGLRWEAVGGNYKEQDKMPRQCGTFSSKILQQQSTSSATISTKGVRDTRLDTFQNKYETNL